MFCSLIKFKIRNDAEPPLFPRLAERDPNVASEALTSPRGHLCGFGTNVAVQYSTATLDCISERGNVQAGVEMKATIFHNPSCGTSRKTLQRLEDSGAEVTVIEYLKTPPSRDELKRIYERAGMSPRDGLRAKEPLAAELGLDQPGAGDDRILDAMMAHPILINRPLVETDKGAALCRPQEEVERLL